MMSRPKLDTPEKLQKYVDDFFRANPKHQLISVNDVGITQLALEGVKFPDFMTYINLSYNSITSLTNVTFNPSVYKLQVADNQLTSLDGVIFPLKLNDLDLSRNEIQSLDGVEFPPGLVTLRLTGNRITSFAGMQFPLSLLDLKLEGNPIDVQTVSELKNPSPFVIREIVAAFPETAQHFKRMEEEKEEKVEQLFKMLYAFHNQKGGSKKRTRYCKISRKIKKKIIK